MENTMDNFAEVTSMRYCGIEGVHKLLWVTQDSGAFGNERDGPLGDWIHGKSAFMEHVKDFDTVISAGGNCGMYVRFYGNYFKNVYTFEPDPINFLCLTLNCGNNVIKTQACVGNERKFVSIDRGHDSGAIHVSGLGNIPTVIIDDMNLSACDLIQLDIEGYELFALQGAKHTIEKYHPLLMIEWYEPWAERYSTNKTMLDNFLNNLGYSKILSHTSDIIYKYQP
jgi:FkbM family methyltransferase